MAATGAAAFGLRAGLSPVQAAGKELPHLTDADPTAKALGYTEDASKVDKTKFPSYKPGAMCGNCNFFQGQAGEAYGPCQIFAGKSVNTKGWCASHTPKAK
ncbi:MAG TPA: high-potential iron-sulfur protein, partial [Steroidobacteraceae bacterium]|nr:high-potential iron-sulfur protein [Steroidobacteraceae bacterium]